MFRVHLFQFPKAQKISQKSKALTAMLKIVSEYDQEGGRRGKSQGGIIGFSRDYAAYYRWCMTRHLRAQYVEVTAQRTKISNGEVPVHKDLRASPIQSSDQDLTS